MKNRVILIIMAALTLILASCGPAATNNQPTASPSPSETETPPVVTMPGDVTDNPTDWFASDPNNWDYSSLPFPQLSDADSEKFNPDKITVYLTTSYADDKFSVIKSEIKDDKLYLTIKDDLSVLDVNDVYQDMVSTYSLSDEDILKLKPFSACVIHDGYMYASEDAWTDRQNYGSYDEWKDSAENPNYLEVGSLTLDPVPVSKDAKISLLCDEDGSYHNMTEAQFKTFAVNLKTTIDDIDIECTDGVITAIFQNDDRNAD